MESLLTLLPLLACPLMMGLMMWVMMRGQPNQTSDTTSAVETPAGLSVVAAHAAKAQHAHLGMPNTRPLWTAFALCLNWKVVVALGMVGVLIWVVAPGLIWAAVPVLLLAACPLAMLLMRGMQGTSHPLQTNQSTVAPLNREEQLSDLRSRLASMQAERDVLAREITALTRGHTGVERETEAAVHGTNGRGAP